MKDIGDIVFNEQWDRVLEEISMNENLITQISPNDLAWKRIQYQLAENGKEKLLAPFGDFKDLLALIEKCKNEGMVGQTIPQATAFQQFDQIKTLLNEGHILDEQDFEERTGLLIAAALDDLELVQFFIDKGAFVSFYDQDNFEAIDLTTSKEIVEILAGHGGKTKAQRRLDYDEYCDARERLNLNTATSHITKTINDHILVKNKNLETGLSTEVIDKFLKLLYFGRKEDIHLKCINRAYRDFSRTLRKLPKEKEDWKNEQRGHLNNAILSMIETSHTQSSFDIWHEETCKLLGDNLIKNLSIGQSQKWINMSLKYMLCFGDKEIKGISKNIQYYHIPIDNIIQKEFKSIHSINPILGPWSAIKCYPTYLNYQNEIRSLTSGIPLTLEFDAFNSALS